MRQAVIDIGSNAIRASVYDNDTLGAPEIYNNKFKINLQKFIDSGNYDVQHSFYLVIQYFRDVFKNLSVDHVACVATAGFRSSSKHADFCQYLKEKYNFDIKVISGEEEAKLSASGVLLGFSNPEGIVADLGGGSLELAKVHDKKLGQLASLHLGSRAIKDTKSISVSEIENIIKDSFDHTPQKNLYLIGGGFRIIAKNYVAGINYPLKSLHSLEILKQDILKYFGIIEPSSEEAGIIHGSYPTKVAKALINVFNPEKIIISSYGVKEGIRFSLLSDVEKSKDVVFERVKDVTKASKSLLDSIPHYQNIVSEFLINPDEITIGLTGLVMMFNSMVKSIEPNLRPSFLMQFILSIDTPLTHRQRVMLAVATFSTFRPSVNMYLRKIARRMLAKIDFANASIIGKIFYIIGEIDGYEYIAPSFKICLGQYNQWIIDANKILPYDIFMKVKTALKTLKKVQSCVYTDQELNDDLTD